MLTDLYTALTERLSPLEPPVYLADCVPDRAVFPYITLSCVSPLTSGERGALTVTVWTEGHTANVRRLVLADEVLALLPPRGLCLTTASGAALLQQKGGASCVQESKALGVRIDYKVQFIPREGGNS